MFFSSNTFTFRTYCRQNKKIKANQAHFAPLCQTPFIKKHYHIKVVKWGFAHPFDVVRRTSAF